MPFDPPIGSITAFAGSPENFPANYRLCDGSAVSRTDPAFTALFNVIGTSWGGDGVTHFNLPDLRGMFLRGVSQGSGRDPDAGQRGAISPGGHAGNDVGSVQLSAFGSHTHSYVGKFLEADGGGGFTGHGFDSNSRQSDALFSMNPAGGSETRPINVNVFWIIRIG